MPVTRTIDADYLVVGAGAMGMAFTDALIDHADVRVALVDRQQAVGGHWIGAYPFVRLHQASAFYGVASTLLGENRVQTDGPEAGLNERATRAEICTYYDRVLTDRMLPSSRVEFFADSDYGADGQVASLLSGERLAVSQRCRIVDARYFAPQIPARTPAPFVVAEGARVVPVNDLVVPREPPSQYVVVGSGKTATDACIWLLAAGVDPGAICWVRPRDPWMLNRAVVQPDPVVYLGMVADTMRAAIAASSLNDLFLRLERAGIMLRLDASVTPTMAKTPTLATWELERLRTIEHVVRLGHLRKAQPGRLSFDGGTVAVAKDALIVHCAASGLAYPPLVPIWQPSALTLQPVRAGFPCFGAALAGYVEATRTDDGEKNRLCPPTPYANSLAEWAQMTVRGAQATAAFGAEPDIKAWADQVALNPARIAPTHPGSTALDEVLGRLRVDLPRGLARLSELSPSTSGRLN